MSIFDKKLYERLQQRLIEDGGEESTSEFQKRMHTRLNAQIEKLNKKRQVGKAAPARPPVEAPQRMAGAPPDLEQTSFLGSLFGEEQRPDPSYNPTEGMPGVVNERQKDARYAVREILGDEEQGAGSRLFKAQMMSPLPFTPDLETVTQPGEMEPMIHKVNRQFTNEYGDPAAIALNLAGSLIPDVAMSLATSGLGGALKSAGQVGSLSARELARRAVTSGMANQAQNVGLAASQAPEGERFSAMGATAIDPAALAGAFLPEAVGSLGVGLKQRGMQRAVTTPELPAMTDVIQGPERALVDPYDPGGGDRAAIRGEVARHVPPTLPEFQPGVPPEGNVSPGWAEQRRSYIESQLAPEPSFTQELPEMQIRTEISAKEPQTGTRNDLPSRLPGEARPQSIRSIEGSDITKHADLNVGSKIYQDQKYGSDIEVDVTFPDGSIHRDRVKGLNQGHALARAASNWPDATKIELIGPVKDRSPTLAEGQYDVQKRRRAGPGAADPGDIKMAELESELDAKLKTTPGTMPVPDGVSSGHDVPPDLASQYQAAIKNVNDFNNPSWTKKVYQGWVRPEFRGRTPEDVAGAIRSDQAASYLRNRVLERAHNFASNVMQKMSPEDRRLAHRFIDEQKNWDAPEMQGKSPTVKLGDLPKEFQSFFQDTRVGLMKMRNDLVKRGYYTPEQINRFIEMDEKGITWLTRDYGQFLTKKKKFTDVDLFGRAVEWVKKNQGIDDAKAISMVQDMITNWDGKGDVGDRWKKVQMDNRVMRGREQGIPGIIRDLMGEVKDPSFVIAASIADLTAAHHQMQVSAEFTGPSYEGSIWSATPITNGAFSHIPVWDPKLDQLANKRRYGEFAGKYVHPALFEALTQADPKRVNGAAMEVVSFFRSARNKAKILYNPGSYFTNFISNAVFSGGAGLPIWSPKFLPRMAQAAKAIAQYNSTLHGKADEGVFSAGNWKGDAQWMDWAIRDGAIKSGFGAEYGGNVSAELAKQLLSKKAGGLRGLLQATWEGKQKFDAKAGNFYEGLDQIWRLANYIHHVTGFVDRAAAKGDVTPEVTRKARLVATRLVDENFPSSGSLGKAQQELVKWAGPVQIGLSYQLDAMRVMYNWMKTATKLPQTKGEGAGRLFNVAIMAGLAHLVIPKALQVAHGMSDEEVKEAETKLKPSNKSYAPFRLWAGRDSLGRARYINISHYLPWNTFFQGDPTLGTPANNTLTRAIQNLVVQPTGLAGQTINPVFERLGLGGNERKPLVVPGEEFQSVGQMVYETFEPGGLFAARRAMEDLYTTDPKTEPLTPGQAVARGINLPFRMMPVESRSEIGAKTQTRAALRETRGSGMAAIRDKLRKGKMTEKEAEKAMEALQEKLQRQMESLK